MIGRCCFLGGCLTLAIVAFGVMRGSAESRAGGDKQPTRDVFDYEAQKTAKNVKRIVFVADTEPHGARGNHEFFAAAIYFATIINKQYPQAYAVVHPKSKWPKDLKHADTIIVLLNDGGSAVNPAVKEAVERGAGFSAIHYAVEVKKGDQGNSFLKWIGGYFETFWSVNPVWTGEFKEIPKHEVTRGVKPFTIKDEWYYHMRFVDNMQGVTPILYALPPLNSLKGDPQKASDRGSNPTVYEEVKSGRKQVVAWAYERPDGGRGFGFTGMHYHSNLGNDDFRTLMLNSVAWVSKLEVPPEGVPSGKLNRANLEQLIDDGKAAMKKLGIK